MSAQQVCPIVGTTNTILPPTHPDFDIDIPGQVCPITNATTDHHHTLQKHPKVPGATADAASCPALKNVVQEPQNEELDEAICPVVGPVSSVLPPDHPSTAESKEGDVCPVTKASLGHHKGKVHQHPNVAGAAKGAVCPVVGKSAV